MSEEKFVAARMSKLEPWMNHQQIVDLYREELAVSERRLSELRSYIQTQDAVMRARCGELEARNREATALLERVRKHRDFVREQSGQTTNLADALDLFLSASTAQPAEPERCRVCGGTEGIDHGSEHMGAVEFPESICETCYRARAAKPPEPTLLERIEGIIGRALMSPAESDRIGTWEAVCEIRDILRSARGAR